MDITLNSLRFLWDFKLFVFKAIDCIFYNKELQISQKLGIISCLPKRDEPRQIFKKLATFNLVECSI